MVQMWKTSKICTFVVPSATGLGNTELDLNVRSKSSSGLSKLDLHRQESQFELNNTFIKDSQFSK